MTRDEAIEKFSHTRFHMLGERRSESWIEVFEVLGILKLDEPINASEQAVSFLIGKCSMPSTHGGDCKQMTEGEARQVVALIEMAGLKIVEK